VKVLHLSKRGGEKITVPDQGVVTKRLCTILEQYARKIKLNPLYADVGCQTIIQVIKLKLNSLTYCLGN